MDLWPLALPSVLYRAQSFGNWTCYGLHMKMRGCTYSVGFVRKSLSQSVDWLILTLFNAPNWLSASFHSRMKTGPIPKVLYSVLIAGQSLEPSNPNAYIIWVSENFIIVLTISQSKPVYMDMNVSIIFKIMYYKIKYLQGRLLK
jgi:hypothetical protein